MSLVAMGASICMFGSIRSATRIWSRLRWRDRERRGSAVGRSVGRIGMDCMWDRSLRGQILARPAMARAALSPLRMSICCWGVLTASCFEIPLDLGAAERAADRSSGRPGRVYRSEARNAMRVLNGLLDIANERMADAIRRISLRRGYDPAEYALVAFGGAGDQHACAVAPVGWGCAP